MSRAGPVAQKIVQRAGPAASRGGSNLAKKGDQIGNLGTYVKNPGISVNWNNVRQHALNRMDKSGITKEQFESWVQNGKAVQQDANTFMFLNREGVAIMSKDGIPQTAYSASKFKDHINGAVIKLFGE